MAANGTMEVQLPSLVLLCVDVYTCLDMDYSQ